MAEGEKYYAAANAALKRQRLSHSALVEQHSKQNRMVVCLLLTDAMAYIFVFERSIVQLLSHGNRVGWMRGGRGSIHLDVMTTLDQLETFLSNQLKTEINLPHLQNSVEERAEKESDDSKISENLIKKIEDIYRADYQLYGRYFG